MHNLNKILVFFYTCKSSSQYVRIRVANFRIIHYNDLNYVELFKVPKAQLH